MAIWSNVALLQRKPGEDEKHLKEPSSSKHTENPSRPNLSSLQSPKGRSRQRSDSIVLTVTSPTFSTMSVGKSHPPQSLGSKKASQVTATKTAPQTETKPETVDAGDSACMFDPELQGDAEVSTSLPSRSTLEKVADLPIINAEGEAVPFKSLYWSDSKEKKKVMIIFIRHFFCGNCQEYLRTLSAAVPSASLPPDTLIRIIGCGSHTLIPSYIEQTSCPYQIFADPSRKLYSELKMVRTLSLGNKGPDYIQHTLASGIVKSIAQGLKRIGSGDALQAGDMKQVGGEFLFEVSGSNTTVTDSKRGNRSLEKVRVEWCHRMKNTRDHAEVPELMKVLHLEATDGQERAPRRTSGAGRRSLTFSRRLSIKG